MAFSSRELANQTNHRVAGAWQWCTAKAELGWLLERFEDGIKGVANRG